MDYLYSKDDLRSAVAAGLLTEAQAAGVIAHGDARVGLRVNMVRDDEPFELFRGFADIFISVGLVLLLSGILGFARVVTASVFVPVFAAGLCWLFARYFTLKRRMTLPSIVLVTGFGISAALVAAFICAIAVGNGDGPVAALVVGGLTMAALLAYYQVFKVPFTLFLVGIAGLAVVLVVTNSIVPDRVMADGFGSFLDLRQGSGLAIGMLFFGVCAFLAGMWFDMHDPHRLGRWSASGFWLHMLAAPALVNTIVLTLYNFGGTTGYMLSALALLFIAALALVIDRRSFLTAGIGYLGLLIAWAVGRGEGGASPILILLMLGGTITALGTWWVPLRAVAMRALPDFPGKTRLPPYGDRTAI